MQFILYPSTPLGAGCFFKLVHILATAFESFKFLAFT
jgi:hypothetical protein